jgi:hypothetical protein
MSHSYLALKPDTCNASVVEEVNVAPLLRIFSGGQATQNQHDRLLYLKRAMLATLMRSFSGVQRYKTIVVNSYVLKKVNVATSGVRLHKSSTAKYCI